MGPACVSPCLALQISEPRPGVGRPFGGGVQAILTYALVRGLPSDNACGGKVGAWVLHARRFEELFRDGMMGGRMKQSSV